MVQGPASSPHPRLREAQDGLEWEVPIIRGLRAHSASKLVGFPLLVLESVRHPQMLLTSQDPKI